MNFAKVKNKDLFDEFSTYNSVEDKSSVFTLLSKKVSNKEYKLAISVKSVDKQTS